MTLEEFLAPYLALSKEELTEELKHMSFAYRAKFDAKLAMLCALTADTLPAPKILPAFKMADGKIAQPKYEMKVRGSVCRAPHKNRR